MTGGIDDDFMSGLTPSSFFLPCTITGSPYLVTRAPATGTPGFGPSPIPQYEFGHFGQCPRVNCDGAKVLPVGCSDIPVVPSVTMLHLYVGQVQHASLRVQLPQSYHDPTIER